MLPAPTAPAPVVPPDTPAPAPPLPPSGMSRVATLALALLLALAFAGAAAWAGWGGGRAGLAFTDSAAAVTYTTGAAIVIERLIETGWALLSTTQLGSYWPMLGVANYAGQLVNGLSAAFEPSLARTDAVLTDVGNAGTSLHADATSLRQDVVNFQHELAGLRQQGRPGNQQGLVLSAATAQRIRYLREKYLGLLDGIDHAAAVASAAAGDLQSFIATFKDNPGRRIVSLCGGGILGLGTAACLGLDLFAALGKTDNSAATYGLTHGLHVALTGLVIGLGAGSTHELIRLLQESKDTRKGLNAEQPSQF